MQTIRLSRSNWELLDDFEKGKAMALGNEYPLFKAMISDPANVSLQKQRTEQARQDLVNQRRTLQGKNNDLLNQINEGKQRVKNLFSTLEQKEKEFYKRLNKKESAFAAKSKKIEAARKSQVQKKEQSIESLKSCLDEVYNSTSWKVGNTLIRPFHFLKKLF